MAYYLRWGSGILGVEGGPPEKYQYFSYGAFSEFEQREYFQYRIQQIGLLQGTCIRW